MANQGSAGDPRQSAYEAVYAYLRGHPSRVTSDYERAVANGRVWRAVESALDAMDVPKVSASDLYPPPPETEGTDHAHH